MKSKKPAKPHDKPVNTGANGRGGEIRTHDLLHPKHVMGLKHSATSDTKYHFMPCYRGFGVWVIFILHPSKSLPPLSR